MSVKHLLSQLLKDERGTSAVEYGFLLGMIVIGLIAAVNGLGSQNGGIWAKNLEKVQSATGH